MVESSRRSTVYPPPFVHCVTVLIMFSCPYPLQALHMNPSIEQSSQEWECRGERPESESAKRVLM